MEQQVELPERVMKQFLENHLLANGWQADINWIPNNRLDILAKKDARQWIIEVKGSGTHCQSAPDAFVTALGEIMQKMDDFTIKYSIALPQNKPFQRLWQRLPSGVKQKLGLTALFVTPFGLIIEKN
jgi:hypothetical protein